MRYMWKLQKEVGGRDEVKRYDSYECFNCCLVSEHVSSVMLMPDSVVESCRPGKLEALKKKVEVQSRDEETLRSGFVFIVGTTEGTIHLFSSFSPPVKLFNMKT